MKDHLLLNKSINACFVYCRYLLSESTKSQNAVPGRGSYIPKFSKRMMNVVVESVAFPYPHLLPKRPFRMEIRDKSILSEFIPMED